MPPGATHPTFASWRRTISRLTGSESADLRRHRHTLKMAVPCGNPQFLWLIPNPSLFSLIGMDCRHNGPITPILCRKVSSPSSQTV
ncbi:MAG: hypothetical protein MUC60_13475 [Oscillatoria sp. Prado101]|nr:hypothetical protein [Oscillatoria sp. Prado101]